MTYQPTAISDGPNTLPNLPGWATSGRAETLETVAFRSGAALSHLIKASQQSIASNGQPRSHENVAVFNPLRAYRANQALFRACPHPEDFRVDPGLPGPGVGSALSGSSSGALSADLFRGPHRSSWVFSGALFLFEGGLKRFVNPWIIQRSAKRSPYLWCVCCVEGRLRHPRHVQEIQRAVRPEMSIKTS